MAVVVSCPRCAQSRTMPPDVHPSPCYCPFCHLELDLPAEPRRADPPAMPRGERHSWLWLGVLLAALVLGGALAVMAWSGPRRAGAAPRSATAAPDKAAGTHDGLAGRTLGGRAR